jgi:Uma2 family endonuclease
MTDIAEKRMTVAEFLTRDDGTDRRYELVRGKPVAMPLPRVAHSVIVANLGARLQRKLNCYYVGSAAGVIQPDRDDTFYLSDLVVSCTPLRSDMAASPRPTVVIEVLSPSTIEHDRGRKAYDYRRIPSVQRWRLLPANSDMSRLGAAAAPSGKPRI